MESLSENNHLSNVHLQDAIFVKLRQAKAILTCVMFATEFVHHDLTLDSSTIYNALWAVDDYLDDIEKYFEKPQSL